MDYVYEIVTTPENIPAKIIINSSPEVVYQHWHKDLELVYSYEGSFTAYINGKIYLIKNKQLTLVNSGDIHSITDYSKDSATTLSILISYDFLKHNYSEIDNVEFKLSETNLKSMNKLEEILEEICITYINDMNNNNKSLLIVEDQKFTDKFHYLKLNSLIYQILYILLSEFSIKKDMSIEFKTKKHMERIKIITDFIDNNYKDDISLCEIARKYELSKEYIATIFKKYSGITIGTYLKNKRLKSAYIDLVNTDYSINQLAFDNGFPNIKSFINSFKKQYGKTPYEYKKCLKDNNNLN